MTASKSYPELALRSRRADSKRWLMMKPAA